MQLSNALGSLHGPSLIMRVRRPQTEIAPFQAGGETQWYDFNFNAIAQAAPHGSLAICLPLGYNPRLYFHCLTMALLL